MSSSLQLHNLLDHALTGAGLLARELLDAMQSELDARPQHFALREGWRKVRANFADDFEAKLGELLQAGRRGEDPLHQPPLQLGGQESLSPLRHDPRFPDRRKQLVAVEVADHEHLHARILELHSRPGTQGLAQLGRVLIHLTCHGRHQWWTAPTSPYPAFA